MKTHAILVLAALSLASVATAQNAPITDYLVKYYAPGAPAPLQSTDPFSATAVLCGQAAPASNTSTVNPTRIVWDDPTTAGRVCIYAPAAGSTLLSFPVGAYEATLTAINVVGPGAESARVPFSRAVVAAAPAGLRFIR